MRHINIRFVYLFLIAHLVSGIINKCLETSKRFNKVNECLLCVWKWVRISFRLCFCSSLLAAEVLLRFLTCWTDSIQFNLIFLFFFFRNKSRSVVLAIIQCANSFFAACTILFIHLFLPTLLIAILLFFILKYSLLLDQSVYLQSYPSNLFSIQ